MRSSISCLILVVCMGLVSLPQNVYARTGGITQTTFFSTDSGFSGATSSSFIGPDGTKKGECTYTNKDGKSVTIKFEETRDGKVTANSGDGANADAELKKCQAEIAKLQQDLNTNLQQNQQAHAANMAQLEANMKDQMALFQRQQETFAEQHRQFLRQMTDFNRKMEDQARVLQDSFGGQNSGQQGFNPFGFSFF